MDMQPRDLFWTISIPFRMYNTKELDINKFIFTLSFDAALKNCDVSTARKVVALALEKDLIERDANKSNILRAKFELWEPKLLPPSWSPTFVNLENISAVDLVPLESTIEYKPRPVERIKRAEPKEMDLFFKSRAPKVEQAQEVEEKEEEIIPEKLEEEKEEVTEKRKKAAPKKKPAKKQEKTKGQKSIQDFFR